MQRKQKNFKHQEHQTNAFLPVLKILQLRLHPVMQHGLHSRKPQVMLLMCQRTSHTSSYFYKQMLVIGYVLGRVLLLAAMRELGNSEFRNIVFYVSVKMQNRGLI
jgi:hypothetical protein